MNSYQLELIDQLLELNYTELNEVMDKAMEEQDRRYKARREEVWKTFVKALRAYTSEYGNIFFYNDNKTKAWELDGKEDYTSTGDVYETEQHWEGW